MGGGYLLRPARVIFLSCLFRASLLSAICLALSPRGNTSRRELSLRTYKSLPDDLVTKLTLVLMTAYLFAPCVVFPRIRCRF
jgi:hypothetical protein